jgi:hypothetical protein
MKKKILMIVVGAVAALVGVMATCIFFIGCGKSLDGLIEELEHPEYTVRESAASDLGKMGDPGAVEPLIKALKDEAWQVRDTAAEALGEIGDSRAVTPLVEALQDEAWQVRMMAAYALGYIGDPKAVEPLIKALEDEESSVRRGAAFALGRMDDPRAADPLVAALQDEESSVRETASEALRKMGDPRAAEYVEKDHEFGFSFDYPDGMSVKEKGYPLFSTEANEEAGVLTFIKSQLRLDVSWVNLGDVDRSRLEELILAYLSGRKADHDIYLGDTIESKCMGHPVFGRRFVTSGEDGVLLNVIVAWHCDTSGRCFTVTSSGDWEEPVFITDGTRMIPEWPDSKHDPSFKAYKEVMSSFQCH